MLLKDKIAVVTGSSRGIGYAIVQNFLSNGAIVIYTSRTGAEVPAELQELAAKHSTTITGVQLDISDEQSIINAVKAVMEQHKRIDVWVNNAGITQDGLILRMPKADFDKVINTNLTGAFIACREVANIMVKQRSGAIINMASIVGKIGNAGQTNYSASKGGLIALTKSLAREVAARGVRVNAIAPGFIATDMTNVLTDAQKEAFTSQIPLKRLGTADDVATATVFLASDLAGYITGHVLDVNGGLLMD
ncbi:MAG: 3-oxoacyl-[acyl-carrier-protein] reductase [Spirochaetaceae bacterium]|nr:3-oxoacyl-[acyl-carrier-protein] reductase [Spirochaetaceae bacterium]